MSKGRDLTKKKWRNGQRQKGSYIYNYLCPHLSSPIRSWSSDKGHGRKKRTKYPRTGKFLKRFSGKRLSMRMPYFFVRSFNPYLTNIFKREK